MNQRTPAKDNPAAGATTHPLARAGGDPASAGPAGSRYLGIDVGAETLKLVELERRGSTLVWSRRRLIDHGKDPSPKLLSALEDWDWAGVGGAAVTGRLSRPLDLYRVPAKQAQAGGYRFLFGETPATVVSIGSHGFSVLELRGSGVEVYRENSRCSQGTGNFLRQLVERFALTVEEASELCADLEQSAPLSGRCPVILKTDMTHLANKGEDRARILAGLYDAVCENVLVLIKPGLSPERVVLIGGVSRSRRIRRTFAAALDRDGLQLVPCSGDDALYFEALGSAVLAAGRDEGVPALDTLLRAQPRAHLATVPALSASLPQVRRMTAHAPAADAATQGDLILGLDIGSTGSKLVALTAATQAVAWEGYRRTAGDPVGAAQALVRQFQEANPAHGPVRALAATGSGREIAGSLLTTCYGKEAVYILNEIAAHAAGALHYDGRVDTIFEIGGQDAKYIRLAEGRVVDAAMNEACSAGTGSFIEEQGSKFTGATNVVQMGEAALAAPSGVSLGQHCSVFMAEIIDEAAAAGVAPPAILAGLYDSIIQNYLNRVKGNRSIGQVIFCQGMPFSADALAAAVARQTGAQVVIPPNPGTVGAMGIALLARRELAWTDQPALDLATFLSARIEKKETFVCKSTSGCGGGGNRCRIECIRTVVTDARQNFTWGGACSLYDKGTRKRKLPDRAPDPFREREALVQELERVCGARRGRPTIAISEEFALKGVFPFFATYLHELGFDLVVQPAGDAATLKRGIQEANIPFCAPMQLHHGVVGRMAETDCDYLFLPMVRTTARVADEPHARLCPIVQASTDMVRWNLGAKLDGRVLAPVLDVGPGNLESAEFRESCRQVAVALEVGGLRWRPAYDRALAAQAEFDAATLELGRRALVFCAEQDVVPVVVLGRPYTIYNKVLNSNVPALLREQGAVAIPIDCYPVSESVPVFADMYWGYGQRILRAAHQIRRTPGIYSLYCSNYSCGPDSFNLHFYAYAMEGRPFAVIETDGHSGDAGTKTRIEAFLHCVRQDLEASRTGQPPLDLTALQDSGLSLMDIRPNESVLVPRMGPGSEVVVASLQGLGLQAELLEAAEGNALQLGRRYTSGKECLPMCMTLGTLLDRLEREPEPDRNYFLVMPRTCGPCRFGTYNLLNQITLERLGWRDRVRIWAPVDSDYFAGTPPGFSVLLFAGFIATDLLFDALLEVRPVEQPPGSAQATYERYHATLLDQVRQQAHGQLPLRQALWEVASGRLFGLADLLRRAAAEFAAIRSTAAIPTVLVVGEIYVRLNAFANDQIIGRLNERGIRARLAPMNEWLEYCTYYHRDSQGWENTINRYIQRSVQAQLYRQVARPLGWPSRTTVHDSLAAAAPYIRPELEGEAVLTLGNPLFEWRHRHIDAVISVGPLECMPNKIAEAQFFHVAEQEGLLALTLGLNGDPVDPEVLDNFAFEVRARFAQRSERGRAQPPPEPDARDRHGGPTEGEVAPASYSAASESASTAPSRW